MRKRSTHRPRPVILNPMAYVMEGLKPVAHHGSFLLDLKIRNHAALLMLTRGTASRVEIDELIAALNITEALWRLGFGTAHADAVMRGLGAMREIAGRGLVSGKFVLRGSEMQALNYAFELHDAQLDAITVNDMERAIALVRREHALKRMTPIVPKETS